METTREIDKRESLRVVTDNSIIDAKDISMLSLDARKLFYVAVSQCKRGDKEFYTYETTPTELAEMWDISRQQVYKIAKKICKELMGITIELPNGAKGFKMRHLFELCDYDDDSVLVFRLHKEMTDMLLGLKKDFSKPLMWDFMRMRSTYSMALWHLFQKEMHSFKPMMSAPIEFDLTLEELRKATGTENKLKQVGEFKKKVLDRAVIDIKRNCWVDISYTNLKRGRFVTGFRFTAQNIFGSYKIEDLEPRMQKKVRKAQLVRKKADGTLTADEFEELEILKCELDQLSFSDYDENGQYKGDEEW